MSEKKNSEKTDVERYLTQQVPQVAFHVHPSAKIYQVIRWFVPGIKLVCQDTGRIE